MPLPLLVCHAHQRGGSGQYCAVGGIRAVAVDRQTLYPLVGRVAVRHGNCRRGIVRAGEDAGLGVGEGGRDEGVEGGRDEGVEGDPHEIRGIGPGEETVPVPVSPAPDWAQSAQAGKEATARKWATEVDGAAAVIDAAAAAAADSAVLAAPAVWPAAAVRPAAAPAPGGSAAATGPPTGSTAPAAAAAVPTGQPSAPTLQHLEEGCVCYL